MSYSKATYNKFRIYARDSLKLSYSEMLKAWRNTKKHHNHYNNPEDLINKIDNGLGIASFFLWSKTPEGSAYWSNIHWRGRDL